ncbi:hypothetical protein MKW92_014136 [Papaver armeniacum]|nr:hypothetical protein MKW92_014136 [Papaver armeniacum]
MGNLLCRIQVNKSKVANLTLKDNVFVNVVASIQYRALGEKETDAFYKLSNTRGQIQAYVLDVPRASVPKLILDDVFEQKNDIARAVEEELEKAMSAYGYKIVQTPIVDIEPYVKIKRAMNNAGKIFDSKVNVPTGTSVKVTCNGLRNSAIGISVNVLAGTSAKVTCNGLETGAGISLMFRDLCQSNTTL